jgi:hypothetical protein
MSSVDTTGKPRSDHRVVHCKRRKYDVYIGRGSVWGNPFKIGKHGTREEVIAKYEEYILSNSELLERLPELKGKVLGCWCAPRLCHGDILVRLLQDFGIEEEAA